MTWKQVIMTNNMGGGESQQNQYNRRNRGNENDSSQNIQLYNQWQE